MSDWIARVGLGLLILLCASFCLTQLAEVDLHWHLLAGQRILQEGAVPRVDTFTYASAGHPWTDLHWLFQVLLALVHRSAGWPGLEGLKIALIAGAFSLAMVTALRRDVSPAVAAPLLFLAILASQERFTLRPEALSFLFLAALLFLLGERRRRPVLMLLVPPLMALWANCHALFVVGAAVLVLTIAGDGLETWGRSRPEAEPARGWSSRSRTAWIAILALGATLLTPYGWAGWGLPWRLLFERIATDNVYARSIAEFQPPFGGYDPTASIAAFAILAVVVMLAMIVGWRSVRVSDAPVLTALLALALLARRNIPLFALAAVPGAVQGLDEALRRAGSRFAASARGVSIGRRLTTGIAGLLLPALTLFLLADVWSNRFFERDGTQRYFGRGWAPGFYPEGAADFILEGDPPGEVIHDMTMGGYLAWRFQPSRRTFIDGRLEVHDQALFSTYLALQTDPSVFEETATRFGARTVLWSHRHSPEAAGLLRYLAQGHGWRPVFVDLAASVFTRDESPQGAPTIDLDDPSLAVSVLDQVRRAEAASARLDPAPAFLRRLLPRRDVPVAVVNAALFFGAVGSNAVAESLFREALKKAPDNAVVHYDLGLVLDRSGRPSEARREFESALLIEASFSPAREALALRRLGDGDPEGALRDWEAAERRAPLASPSLAARGALLAARGRIDEAIEDYRRAVALSPRDADQHAALALLCRRSGLKEEAAVEIRRALLLDPHGCASLVAFGRMSAEEGRFEEAERSFREAFSASRPCPQAAQALQDLRSRGSGPP
ncbi:MAG TPA: tetratricopeptide repeat protein [Candidatus Dormibacteraeota bacterium]|nr:tetratricopeptide repeat protein [Candidatus Dormibacteraeota bacterium]